MLLHRYEGKNDMRYRNRRRGRDVAILLGGIAAGIVGGRMLPPLFLAVVSSNRTRAGADPFAVLIADHREIVSILDQMAAMPTGSTARRARLFLRLKRKLAKHAMAEEDVVYPNVESDSATHERKHMYDDHAEMKVLLYEIEEQLKSGEDWSGSVMPLRELVRRHVDEEEKGIFPELRRRLSESRLPKVAGMISREEALIV